MNDNLLILAEKIIQKTGINETKEYFIEHLYLSIFSSSLPENKLIHEQLHSHQDHHED
jgi:hypothetical protein